MDGQIPLLLLGCYHMDNPGRDLLNLVADDVRTPERQRQIESLVRSLAAFQPTKIAVEVNRDDPGIDARYREDLAHLLGHQASEVVQIGFRLGRLLGHERVHPIDAEDSFWDEAIDRATTVDPQHRAALAEMTERLRMELEQDQHVLATSSVAAFLARLNEPAAIASAHEPYLRYLAGVIHDGEHVGATAVGGWYRRNLKIFANLLAIASPGDRIIVVYGSGHIPLLQHLASSSGVFELIDPLPYLRE